MSAPAVPLWCSDTLAENPHYPSPSQAVITSSPFGLGPLSTSEAQLRSSPIINQMQKDLNDLQDKLDSILNWISKSSAQTVPPQAEYNKPFSSYTPSIVPASQSFVPDQCSNDIDAIQTRINTLTNSVSQLLPPQVQGHAQNTGMNRPVDDHSLAVLRPSQTDTVLNQTLPGMHGSSPNVLHHGVLPYPRNLRGPTRKPPSRTWYHDSHDKISHDKRRSVPNRMCRDSAGVRSFVYIFIFFHGVTQIIPSYQVDVIGSSRDATGPVSKWEQLALVPELLRRLTTLR